jgi:hypothetical protein
MATLSDDDPVAPGAAFAGTSANVSRADHVHPVPWPASLIVNIADKAFEQVDDGNLVVADQELIVAPIRFMSTGTVNLGLRIVSNSATGDIRFGLWEEGAEYWPDNLIAQSTLTITGLTGRQVSTDGFAVSGGKLYWWGIQNDAGASITVESSQRIPIPTASSVGEAKFAVIDTSSTGALVDFVMPADTQRTAAVKLAVSSVLD